MATTFAVAGQTEPGFEKYAKTRPKATGDGGITAGLMCDYNAGNARVAPTSGAVKPFVGCIETAADGEDKVRVLTYGPFYGWAEDNIPVGSDLMPGSTTAGHMKAFDGVAENTRLGSYEGHPGEAGGGADKVTDATDGQLIVAFIK